jgi:hypothetical protein
MDQSITIGTLIHGTLRDEDLLPAFADELDRVSNGAYAELRDTAGRWLVWLQEYPDSVEDDAGDTVAECVPEVINELIDALQEYAPSHMTFGAHEGDGSDFGWWPSLDFDGCDMRSVPINGGNDSIDVTCGIYISTNDHGNVTVSELRGAVIWSAV